MKRFASRLVSSRAIRLSASIAFIVALVSSIGAHAEEAKPNLLRGSDGKFDMSAYLATRGAFLPTPIIVTEPAVGYGGGLAAIFFHGGNPLQRQREQARGHFVPPSISAVAALATENGTKGGAAGHFGVWRGDRIRYIGGAGAATLNLDYWGSSGRPLDEPLRYNVEASAIVQRLLFRLGDSPVMLGGEWTWSTQEAEFRSANLPPDAPPRKLDLTDSGLGVVGEFETLDNIFTPNAGMKGRVRGKIFSEAIGGDNDRELLDVEGFGYIPIRDRFILGIRGDLAFSDGDTPFYLLPYVTLRGVPALKYAGKHVAVGELEARWMFLGRWSAVGFGGIGSAAKTVSALGSEDSVGSYGVGFRYLIAERLGLQAGLDYGRSPDDDAIYIIVGSAWR